MANEVIETNEENLILGMKMTPANVDVVGLDEMIETTQRKLDDLEALLIDENTEKYARAERAKLNKLKTALKDERIAMGKAIKGNWEESEAKIKAIEAAIESVSSTLGDGINSLSEKRKNGKRAMILGEINKISEVQNAAPDVIEFNEKWLNATFNWNEMLEQINEQFTDYHKRQTELATAIKTIEMYAKAMDIDSVGFIAMLNNGGSIESVQVAIDNAVEVRKIEEQAKKDKQEAEKKKREEEVANAKQVGEVLVNQDTGEVVDPFQEPTADFQYTFKALTADQKNYLDNQFTKWGIEFAAKEV